MTKEKYVNYPINQFDLFQKASKRSIKHLEREMHFLTCESEKILYDYGDDATHCYFIFSGAVKQQNYTTDGRYIHLSHHEKGEYFGYFAAFNSSQRVCRATCQKQSIIGCLDNQTFIDIFLDDKYLTLDLIQESIAFSNEQILMRTGKNILSSQDIVILDLLRRRQKLSSNFIDMPPRKEWAAYLGVAPETLSRVITKIKETGAIKLHDDDIEILNDITLKTKLSD